MSKQIEKLEARLAAARAKADPSNRAALKARNALVKAYGAATDPKVRAALLNATETVEEAVRERGLSL